MLGFIFGTICLVALIGVLRRGRHRWYGHGYGYGGWHGRGWGPRAFFWRLLRRIDATPAQEKVFRDEVVSFIDAARGMRDTWRASRSELAGALRDESLDRGKLEALYRKQDELIAALRQRVSESLGRVHETLDAQQRRTVADLVESGSAALC
jgi:hypothetical protein